MNLKKHWLPLLLAVCAAVYAFIHFSGGNNPLGNSYKSANDVICPTKRTCVDKNNACKCWCSHKCGPRDKEPEDSPVYVNDDKYGNYCYCKPWDLENVGRCNLKPKKK
jgi:hypothetical protein